MSKKRKAPAKKTVRQVLYLLGKTSPLTRKQKGKLKSELHTGAVKVAKRLAPKKKR